MLHAFFAPLLAVDLSVGSQWPGAVAEPIEYRYGQVGDLSALFWAERRDKLATREARAGRDSASARLDAILATSTMPLFRPSTSLQSSHHAALSDSYSNRSLR